MGRKNKAYQKDLHQQAYDRLTGMQAFGESKREAVANGTDREKIFSVNTYKTYWKHTKYFLAYIKEHHPECTTLKSAKKYVNEWLQHGNGSKEKLLATKVHNEILKAKLYKKNRGLKEEKFRILSPSIPCCLVEVGFISNVADRLLILENIEQFAIAITKGLLGYYDMQYYQDKENNTIPLNQVLFKVQVGAYKDENNAKKMVERLRELGFNSIIVRGS